MEWRRTIGRREEALEASRQGRGNGTSGRIEQGEAVRTIIANTHAPGLVQGALRNAGEPTTGQVGRNTKPGHSLKEGAPVLPLAKPPKKAKAVGGGGDT